MSRFHAARKDRPGGAVVNPASLQIDDRHKITHVLGNQPEKLFTFPQRLGCRFAFDGILNHPREHLAVDLPLDQVILRAFAHSLERNLLIVQSGQDNDGSRGRGGMGAGVGAQPAFVREREVQKDDIKLVKLWEGGVECLDMGKHEA